MKTIYILLFGFVLLSCGKSHKMESMASMDMSPAPSGLLAFDKREVNESEVDGSSSSDQKLNVERKLIRNGSMNFKVKDIKKSKAEIEQISKSLNGYISNENQNNYETQQTYTQKIRVPAEKFDELILKLEGIAEKIDNKSIDTEDVTEEFIDVESRLKTKRELEERYKAILAKASRVEDLLSIEREMNNVRSEIESMQGRLNYLKNQVSFSTLNITYYESTPSKFGFGSRLAESVSEGWSNLLYFLIDLVSLWPFIILISGAIWWFVHYRRRKKAQAISN